jgi:hypothetical protein
MWMATSRGLFEFKDENWGGHRPPFGAKRSPDPFDLGNQASNIWVNVKQRQCLP